MPYIPQIKISDTTYDVKDKRLDGIVDCFDSQSANLFDIAAQYRYDSGITVSGSVMTGTGMSFHTAGNKTIIGGFRPRHVYQFSAKAYTNGSVSTDGNGLNVIVYYSDGTSSRVLAWANSTSSYTEKTGVTDGSKVITGMKISYSASGGNTWYISDLCIQEAESSSTTYVNPVYSARDDEARAGIQYETGHSFSDYSVTHSDGYDIYEFAKPLPRGKYTLSLNIASTDTSSTSSVVHICYERNYNSYLHSFSIARNGVQCLTFEATEPITHIYILASSSVTNSSGNMLTVSRFVLQYGNSIGSYRPDITIMSLLNTYGECCLDKAEYSITHSIIMPAGSKLTGKGAGSVLKLSSLATGGTWMRVTDETTSDYFYYSGGISSAAPAGLYHLSINVSTPNTQTDVCRVAFVDHATYNSSYVVTDLTIPKDQTVEMLIYFPTAVWNVFVFSGTNATNSSGYDITVNSLVLKRDPCMIIMNDGCSVENLSISGGDDSYIDASSKGSRNGIAWVASDAAFGHISGCRISNFDNSGILMAGTGTPVDQNLAVSDCFITGCYAGINVDYDSEFHKITNCTVTRNHYGMINRGGNNAISNCGFDANIVGMQIDQDAGSNGGHGQIANCTFNHSDSNNGYGLIIRDTGRELVTNCNFYYSDILLQNTNGNIISNCGFGQDAVVEITGGECSIIDGCMMRTSDNTITLTNNSTSKVVNCYTRTGAVVSPITAS